MQKLTKKSSMQDPEIYKQLGELTGRFNTFEQTMAREFDELKQTIREQKTVSFSTFEKQANKIDANIAIIQRKIDEIEDANRLKEATITGRLSQFIDKGIVKIIGTTIITAFPVFIYITYQHQIDALMKKVDNIGKVQEVLIREEEKR